MTGVGGTLVLDAEGLSGWLNEKPRVMAFLAAAHRNETAVVASAVTILEVSHARLDRRRLEWVLSRIRIEPVTERSARSAASLLIDVGLHGHSHAIDAVVAELASRQSRPVAVLTSDAGDLTRLCPAHVRVVPV